MIGQRFGNYRAVSLLGEGGMGAVYLAEHPQIGRRVAVKVLRPEMIRDPQLLVRFLNEARAANAIRHPNIIEVLDSGTTPEGVPYLVMELLEGEVLSARIRRVGKVPLREALEFAYQTASALAAAHAKGIVHRDLKPDNLFVIADPADANRELIKVLDFGIAKLQTLPTGGGMQTRTGMLMGTPVYMSPEQCLGTKSVDHRSDIYALGIIMFEMLAGRPPFLSEGFGELVNMHLNVRPPSLSDLNATVTVAVEGVIAKALEKSPDARQRSATELQIDIRAAAGQSVVLRGASSPDLAAETLPGNTAGAMNAVQGLAIGGTLAAPSSRRAGSTTMTSSTGERYAPTIKTKSSFGVVLVVGALVLVAAGGGFLVMTRMKHGGATGDVVKGPEAKGPGSAVTGPTAPEDKQAPLTVHVTIDSSPAGASVIDTATGAPLGNTPVLLVRPASDKGMTVRIEKAGFVASTLEVALSRDTREVIDLAAATPAGKDSAESHDPASRPKTVRPGQPGRARPHHQAVHEEDEPAKL
ncbi:MAG TPA: serine/threonine-protein kinase [Polyangia bacterium]